MRANKLKQNCCLRENLSEEFFEKSEHNLYFDMEHFKEVYKEIESLKKNFKCEVRFAPKFDYSKNPLREIEKFWDSKILLCK